MRTDPYDQRQSAPSKVSQETKLSCPWLRQIFSPPVYNRNNWLHQSTLLQVFQISL